MKTRNTANALIAASVCMGLSSCWFNSAGYIFDKAHYQAASDTKDIKPGDSVYENDGKYYVKIPRFKIGKGPQIMYPNDSRGTRHLSAGEQVFQIPADYAAYLCGNGVAQTPEYLKAVGEQEIEEATAMGTVRQAPQPNQVEYKVTSPNAVWLDTAGVFEVLCVDLPVSATLTSLALAGFTAVTFGQQQVADIKAWETAPPCEHCDGKGGWSSTTRVNVYNGLGYFLRTESQTNFQQCTECGGTGKQGGQEIKMRREFRKGLIRSIFQH